MAGGVGQDQVKMKERSNPGTYVIDTIVTILIKYTSKGDDDTKVPDT